MVSAKHSARSICRSLEIPRFHKYVSEWVCYACMYTNVHAHTHTHTHARAYIYMCMRACIYIRIIYVRVCNVCMMY